MVQAKRRVSAETRLKGVPQSPGVALGRPCLYSRPDTAPASTQRSHPGEQRQRLHHALKLVARERSVLAREADSRLGPEHAGIFAAHHLMLDDEDLRSRLLEAVENNGCSAETAVEQALDDYKTQLEASDSEYLRQRVTDISELQQSLSACLRRTVARRHCRQASGCNVAHCRLGNNHILVAREIGASLPIENDRYTTGYVVENAGPDSHAVILARALRRPVVGNIADPLQVIPADAEILIDGNNGEVIINPGTGTLAFYQAALAGAGSRVQVSEPVAGLTVMANIGRSCDVDDALAAGAEGVGLYRTEMEMLAAGRLLDEDEQAARYSQVLKAMHGRPVYIRLLDLGDDKSAQWLAEAMGDATVSGRRGARLLLEHPELLRTQARALARACEHGNVRVVYPMIISLEQFLALRRLFDEAVGTGLRAARARLQHGVLFEVPGACLTAERIMQAADFGCIGTNDLIQYLYAHDRNHGDTPARAALETDTALWELMQQVAGAAQAAGKPLSVCGELAGNPELTTRIVDTGIEAISTSPARIAGVRRALRKRLGTQETPAG
jgi:phosphotransferase system enzyme I (PtsI)